MNARGFSLVEVLIATALLGVVTIGTATMISGIQADQNGVKFRMDGDTFEAELRANLSNVQACANTFKGTAGDSKVLTVYNGSSPGQAVYTVGSTYGDRSITLQSLDVRQFAVGPGAGKGQMAVVATLTPTKTSTGAQMIVRQINIANNLDATAKVTDCIALAKMTDGIWQRTTTNLDNITFNASSNGGWVGIMNGSPLSTLDVSGPVRSTTTGHRNMPIALIPNTEGLGGIFIQGLGFNLGFDRANQNWPVGGDGVNSGAVGLLMDHGNADLRFFSVPSKIWSIGYALSTSDLMKLQTMVLTGQGQLGIGVPNPNYQLQLSTDSAAKPGTGAWTIASDERLKDVGREFGRGLAEIEKIVPRYFRYRPGNPLGLPDDREYVGAIAQNVEANIPEAVSRDKDGYLHLTSDAVQWTMLNAIRELAAQNAELRTRVDTLARELARTSAAK